MTDQVKNQPGPSTIVNNPRLWPASFVKPEKQTRVCIRTYIFSDTTKVQKFLDFIKEKFPNRKVDVKQLDNGNVSVSLTSGTSSSNDSEEEGIYRCSISGDLICFKFIGTGKSKYGAVFGAFNRSSCYDGGAILPFITFESECGPNFTCMSNCTMF